MNLSLKQEQIVKSPLEKAIQVLASAGSGKTRVLTERVRYILENTKKDGVIAITFTNKAAEEMKVRLADSNHDEDRVWIATIHSVAQHIMDRYGHTIGLSSGLHIYERDKDRMEVFMQSLRDEGIDIDKYLAVTDTREQKNREKNLQEYINIFSKIKREMLFESDIKERFPDNNVWGIFQDYQKALLESGGIDYDDILVFAHRILITHNWVANIYRSKYKHICVDEAQDLNKSQYEFIKVLCGKEISSVLMVGDPNQMIFGFNSSSKDFLCENFIEDFSPMQFKLSENYRSTKAVIGIANKLKLESQKESEYALEGKVVIQGFETEELEANFIASTIIELLKMKEHNEIEGDITLDKMVVIARNRFVFTKLEETLNTKGIQFFLNKGERQSEPTTLFGKVLDYSIRLRINPKDWVDGKRLCQLLKIPEPVQWAEGVLEQIQIEASAKVGVFPFVIKLLSEINSLDIENPNITKFVAILKASLTSFTTDNKISNEILEEIGLSLSELDDFNHSWTLYRRKGLGNSLISFRNALVLGQLAEASPNTGLTLSTVHTMKGLEKDIVFLIGMCEGVFPDYRAVTMRELDEERNSIFVAVTRAKRWLYITFPKKRIMPWGKSMLQQKSRFLAEMEA